MKTQKRIVPNQRARSLCHTLTDERGPTCHFEPRPGSMHQISRDCEDLEGLTEIPMQPCFGQVLFLENLLNDFSKDLADKSDGIPHVPKFRLFLSTA